MVSSQPSLAAGKLVLVMLMMHPDASRKQRAVTMTPQKLPLSPPICPHFLAVTDMNPDTQLRTAEKLKNTQRTNYKGRH